MRTIQPLPLLVSIPHGGLDVPGEVADRLAIDATTVYNECDLWAEALYDFAHPAHTAPTPNVLARVTMPIARVLIDANRPPADWANPDGAVKTHTSYGDPIYRTPLTLTERQMLQTRYWQPFHQRLARAIRQHAAATHLFLDCHNMAQLGPTAYGDPGAPRPLICLANFGDGRGEAQPGGPKLTCPPALLRAAATVAEELFADLTLLEPDPLPPAIVGINRPFVGGYILQQAAEMLAAAKGRAVPSIMIEINRGIFVGRQTSRTPIAPPNQARIAAVRARIAQWTKRLLELAAHADT
jgi:formiminoglutamase